MGRLAVTCVPYLSSRQPAHLQQVGSAHAQVDQTLVSHKSCLLRISLSCFDFLHNLIYIEIYRLIVTNSCGGSVPCCYVVGLPTDI